jgi:hypothetical protein
LTVTPWLVALAAATLPGPEPAVATVSRLVPGTPPIVAVIVLVPTATAVTRPLGETVAAAVLLELHVTGRPVRMLLSASYGIAEYCSVWVGARLWASGSTVT